MQETHTPELTRPFVAHILVKAKTDDDDRWLVTGPVASQKPDLDGEILEKAGIWKGLDMFDKMGKHVDFEHMYRKTQDPACVIGRGARRELIDGVPYLTTELFQHKRLAKSFWEHVNPPKGQAPGEAGYSIEGIATLRDPKDSKRVLETQIYRVTLTLTPKGFDNRVVAGDMPSRSLVSHDFSTLAKSLMADDTLDSGLWTPTNYVRNQYLVNFAFDDIAQDPALAKAFTAGSGVVAGDATGSQAVRQQTLDDTVRETSFSSTAQPFSGTEGSTAPAESRDAVAAELSENPEPGLASASEAKERKEAEDRAARRKKRAAERAKALANAAPPAPAPPNEPSALAKALAAHGINDTNRVASAIAARLKERA